MYMLSFPMLHIFSSKRSRYVFLAWSGGGLVFFPSRSFCRHSTLQTKKNSCIEDYVDPRRFMLRGRLGRCSVELHRGPFYGRLWFFY